MNDRVGGKTMMPRLVKTGLFLTVGIFLFASLALAGTKSLRLVQDVVLPRGQTLKAGEYAVLVNEKVHKVEFLQSSKVVATHDCKRTEQQKKNRETQVRLQQGPGNTVILQQIQLQGDSQIISLTS
jgi:hypothetical protein